MSKKLVHQIWHGDSVELATKFHEKRAIQSVITDPPFGVDNLSKQAVTVAGKKYARKIANDESPEVAMEVFTNVMNAVIPGMREESDIYIFTSYQVLKEWLVFTDDLFAPHGFERKALGIWSKEGPGMGDLNVWGMGMEFILYFKRGDRIPNDKRRNFVLHHQQVHPGKLIHPHEKPTSLLQDLIRYSTKPGEFVLDPFGGSGSLVRAARAIDRSAVAIELDEQNYRLAVEGLNRDDGGMDFGE